MELTQTVLPPYIVANLPKIRIFQRSCES